MRLKSKTKVQDQNPGSKVRLLDLDLDLDLELLKEPLRKLLKPFVSVLRRLLADRFDMRLQRLVAPVIPGRLLCVARHAVARGFQQRSRCRGVEARIIARRQVELASRSTGIVPIIVNKGP
jgi:hypothetical protein